jgi:hypothetical protein
MDALRLDGATDSSSVGLVAEARTLVAIAAMTGC